MQLVSAIITLILCLSFFIIDREKKLIIIFIGNICFDSFQFADFSFATFKSFSYLCFFISELKYISHYITEIKRTPIFKLLLIVFIGAIIVISTRILLTISLAWPIPSLYPMAYPGACERCA